MFGIAGYFGFLSFIDFDFSDSIFSRCLCVEVEI